MYQAEDYQSLNSQCLICLQVTTDMSQGWECREWLTVTLFPVVFDRLATTTEHGICRLQELCRSLLGTFYVHFGYPSVFMCSLFSKISLSMRCIMNMSGSYP